MPRNRSLHLTVDGVLPCCSTNGKGFVVTYDPAQVNCSRCNFILEKGLPGLASNAIVTHLVAGNEEAGKLAGELITRYDALAAAKRSMTECEAALARARLDLETIESYVKDRTAT